MVCSKLASLTLRGRSRRIGRPQLLHLGPAASFARSTRLAASQKTHRTTTGRVSSVGLVMTQGTLHFGPRKGHLCEFNCRTRRTDIGGARCAARHHRGVTFFAEGTGRLALVLL